MCGVISPIVGQVLVVGLHPVSLGPSAALAASGFGSSALLSPWAPNACFHDVMQCILREGVG